MISNKNEDIKILKEVQKNTEMAMKALDTIAAKVFDDDLALQLSRQSLKYSAIHNKAVNEILEGKAQPFQSSGIQDAMLVGGIHINTLLNTSTSHIADLLIQGSSRGLTNMWKSMNENKKAEGYSMEIAKELVDFEEKNIVRFKKYL